MSGTLELIRPFIQPPLDAEFRPAVLANHHFQSLCAENGLPLVIGLERNNGEFSRFETRVLPVGHAAEKSNVAYVERLLKFLLWQRGAFRVYIGGPRAIGETIARSYSTSGDRHFEVDFLGRQVYEKPFEVFVCSPEEVPPANEVGKLLGRHLEGNRIGFDLGASDRKVSAVKDGKIIYSEEVMWEPKKQTDPEYYYKEISTALKTAASKMSTLDAIGGSSAGIYLDNRPMVASLFRNIPPERFAEVKNLFERIGSDFGVPLDVINDGDVTALAGSMSVGENGILGIALGSSQAAGYIDMNGRITGWVNELCFAPVDYSPNAPRDEWSGDIGCGSSYFSQQCVFRLAPKAGIDIPANLLDAEKLKFVQEKLEAGHEGAVKIWQSMGVILGYGLAHYADFYQMRHFLILGRCTSGRGGELLLEGVHNVFEAEFPELLKRFTVHLPDERTRRVGQSVAAASLPALN
ncbi:MAG: transcriptional regulator [Chloroflexi bacterium HGW-Chloroflexi-5]|jgi:predicted NBD/HSP70 family sugar kinase|nr:MAG: transcriptional regulator [Chloroflexi bacterium HGW-Chloroflexi-5]